MSSDNGKFGWTCLAGINGIVCGIILAIIAFLAIFILFPTLMALSFNRVDQDESAIKYYEISNEVVGDNEDDILGSGLHYDINPDTTLFVYPDIFVTMEFSGDGVIKCLSKDGLDMELTITFQYRLIRKELYEVLYDHGKNEHIRNYIGKVSRNAIKNGCGNFTANEYFIRRDAVEEGLSQWVEKYLNLSNSHAQFGLLQLKNIKHPGPFEDANQRKQLAQQDIDKARSEREQKLTEKNTEFLENVESNKAIIIQANGESDAILISANNTAASIREEWVQRTETFRIAKTELGLDSIELADIYLTSLTIEGGENNIIKME